MLRNYLKIALRNLMKFKFISFINLSGLTIGLTSCLLILTYILHELSFDRYNANADRIYRVTRSFNNQTGAVSLRLGTIAPPFGPLLQNDFPDIQKITRLLDNGITPLRFEDKIFNENHVYFADENYFKVFTVRVLRGNPSNALLDPYSVMLTEDMAKKYFGNRDPMNKMIRYNNQFNFKVTGIFQALPSHSHFHPGLLLSFNTLKDTAVYGEENLRTNWGNNSFFTYLLMPENYPVEKIKVQFPAFIDRHMDHKDYNGSNPSKFTTLGLQKLTEIHLYSHMDYEAEENGDIKRVYIFSAIALFILLIACINYMNLSSARSALRAREIGIRKVIGARKKELIGQFLGESVLISWVASLLGIAFLFLTLPWISKVSGQDLFIDILFRWRVILVIFITPFIVGLVSGLYPALFMSSFQPVQTLKGSFKARGHSISFRKILVVVQFAISIILIITTVIVFQQLHFMQQKSLGFDKDHILTIPYNNAINRQFETFRTELLLNVSVRNASRSSRIPTGRLLDDMGASTLVGDSMRPSNTDIKFLSVDYDFIPTYNIHLVAGRNFSRAFGTDTSGFILNEAAIRALGWKSAGVAVNKDFKYGSTKGRVIGVIQDFHFESMHQQIVPLVFVMFPPSQTYFNRISIKIGGERIIPTLAFIERTWNKFLPGIPYEYSFLDENFSNLYKAEQRQGTIFTIFACIAIFIACLGLLGLSAFAITQRIKEIGIRKVLGATNSQIVSMLSRDFLQLVLISTVIAFPIAGWTMHIWLMDFAYRISISAGVFLMAGILALLIAFATISFQAIKAAIANPVKNLRTE